MRMKVNHVHAIKLVHQQKIIPNMTLAMFYPIAIQPPILGLPSTPTERYQITSD